MRLPKQYAVQARGLDSGNRWVIWEGGVFVGLGPGYGFCWPTGR